jgi:hypothetical protein
MSTPTRRPDSPPAGSPWWKHRFVWLVWGGPALVVVASFVTLGIAITHPDPVLPTTAAAAEDGAAATPAMQARNHAATATAPRP